MLEDAVENIFWFHIVRVWSLPGKIGSKSLFGKKEEESNILRNLCVSIIRGGRRGRFDLIRGLVGDGGF